MGRGTLVNLYLKLAEIFFVTLGGNSAVWAMFYARSVSVSVACWFWLLLLLLNIKKKNKTKKRRTQTSPGSLNIRKLQQQGRCSWSQGPGQLGQWVLAPG